MASQFKTVSITQDDYDTFDKIRATWVKKHNAKISMAQMLKIAMDEYQRGLK
jgi:hypothetical protein